MSAGPSEELEAARRKLADSYKMATLGRLLAEVVHEINTPMGSLISNNAVTVRSLETVQRLLGEAQAAAAPPPKKALDILETVAGLAAVEKLACERIAGLVRSLRRFSRADEKDMRLANLAELLDDSLKLAGSAFRHRVTVEKDYADLPEIECYPQLLGQVLLNLLVNAGQAIEGEGRIRVATRREQDQVHITIADSGKGIREEDRSRIFAFGFTTKPLDQGTGLGLAISRDIVVENHHGSIDFESQPGVGTTFHIRIPMVQAR